MADRHDEIAAVCLLEDGTRVCASCGEPIEVADWHPTVAVDSPVRVYLFCDEECERIWNDQATSILDDE